MKPPVIIGIATIEERRESIEETLQSLEDQCDIQHVYASGFVFGAVDAAFMKGKMLYLRDDDTGHGVNVGDAGKFYPFIENESFDHYCLVCDDDLIYPPDYVETLIAGIDRHDRKAVVGFHGKEYYSPVASYYGSFYEDTRNLNAFNYRCLDEVECRRNYKLGDTLADHQVTIIGTGCTGWHSSLFKDNPLSMDDFRHPNMADIWFSKKCNDLGIPRYVIPHDAGWIRHSDKVDMKRTIASTARDNDAIQTGVFNSVEWKL